MAEKERNDANTGKSEGKQGHGKRILLRTFGCQMNVRDSEVIYGLLNREGYRLTDDFRKADVIIFNTCSVRKHAEDRVFSLVGEYTKTKGKPLKNNQRRNNSGAVFAKEAPLVGIVGCMAKNYGEAIFDKSPQVDFAVGPQDIDKIPGIIDKLLLDKNSAVSSIKRKEKYHCGESALFKRKIWEIDGNIRPEEVYHTGFYEDKKHAYIVISEGCSNFCSYCIVPYVRGPIRNRKHKDILEEIKSALDNGIVSFTLLGQNVNAYKDEDVNFMKLLELANKLKEVKNINFMTSHPKDASSSLFQAISSLDKVEKSLHMPVQSGSDRILKLMNRGYTVKDYMGLVSSYRKIVKGGKISTDIIVGFPTEREDDFEDTVDLFKKAAFNSAFIFKYSPRPKTLAFQMNDSVDNKEKERRHAVMLKLYRGMAMFFLFMPLFAVQALALNIDKVKISFLNGNYAGAIKEAEAIIAEDRYSSELYYFLGLSYLKSGEYIRARENFKVVMNNFQDGKLKEESRIGMADTYLLSGDTASAGNIYRGILADNPRTKFKEQINQRLSVIETKGGVLYSVQVGSFANQDNASNLVRKLINDGYSAYIEESGSLDNKSYKARVGRSTNLNEAEELERKLSREGYPTKICP